MELEEIPVVDQLTAIVEGRGKSAYSGVTKVISVRLPVYLAIQLQALSQKAGTTRNLMIVKTLEAGIEEVQKRLAPETIEQLKEFESEALSDLQFEDLTKQVGEI